MQLYKLFKPLFVKDEDTLKANKKLSKEGRFTTIDIHELFKQLGTEGLINLAKQCDDEKDKEAMEILVEIAESTKRPKVAKKLEKIYLGLEEDKDSLRYVGTDFEASMVINQDMYSEIFLEAVARNVKHAKENSDIFVNLSHEFAYWTKQKLNGNNFEQKEAIDKRLKKCHLGMDLIMGLVENIDKEYEDVFDDEIDETNVEDQDYETSDDDGNFEKDTNDSEKDLE